MPLTAERLRELLEYDRDTGIFRWLVSPGAGVKAGDIAGSLHSKGYIYIHIGGRDYAAHRLAVLYVEGRWPIGTVDHRNLVKSHNWWTNLREATHARNCANRRLRSDSSTGFKGVSRRGNRWRAKLMVDGQRVHIGYFATAEEAHAAYVEAAKTHFGEFARAG